jgi:two-component system sensor histidine kinase VicK
LAALFNKFVRAANATKVNSVGTGLGLYVVKKIIESHHGKVWVESGGEGKGSEFYVELPTL